MFFCWVCIFVRGILQIWATVHHLSPPVIIPFTGLCRWQALVAIFHVVARVTGWIKEVLTTACVYIYICVCVCVCVYVYVCLLPTACLHDCNCMIIWGFPDGSKPLERVWAVSFVQTVNQLNKKVNDWVLLDYEDNDHADRQGLRQGRTAFQPHILPAAGQSYMFMLSFILLYILNSSCYDLSSLTIFVRQHWDLVLQSMAPFWKLPVWPTGTLGKVPGFNWWASDFLLFDHWFLFA